MSLKNLNFDKPITAFDGKDSGEGTLGQLLARVLASESSEDKLDFIKLAGWVKQLWAKEPLTLDKSDLDKLKSIVERNKMLMVWTKALMFEILESPDDTATAKTKAKDSKDQPGPHPPGTPIKP